MQRMLLILTMTTIGWAFQPVPARAAPRERVRLFAPAYRLRAETPAHHYPSRPNPYDDYKQYYPKYYGSFHSRYFNDQGIPSGDVGLRGNSLYMTPW